MLAHELAKKLLELSNLPVVHYESDAKLTEPKEDEVIDYNHPNYRVCQEGETWEEYVAKMPKQKVILM